MWKWNLSHFSCRLLITFSNSLDPDQDRHCIGPDPGPTRLALWESSRKISPKKLILREKNQQTKTTTWKIPSMQRLSQTLNDHAQLECGGRYIIFGLNFNHFQGLCVRTVQSSQRLRKQRTHGRSYHVRKKRICVHIRTKNMGLIYPSS